MERKRQGWDCGHVRTLTLFFLLVLAYWPRLYNFMFACACCVFSSTSIQQITVRLGVWADVMVW